LGGGMIYRNISGRGHEYWKRLDGRSSNKLIPVDYIDGVWCVAGFTTANWCKNTFELVEN